MRGGVPENLDEIDETWLSAWLVSAGRADQVRVVAAVREDNPKWHVADTAFISIAYEGAGALSAPSRIFVKLRGEPDPFAPHFPGEIVFYGWAAGSAKSGHPLPVPACHLALSDKKSGASLIFLDDLRETHAPLDWGAHPDNKQCLQVVRALASLHAVSWVLPVTVDTSVIRAREERVDEYIGEQLLGFVDALNGLASPDAVAALEDVCRTAYAFKVKRLTSMLPLCACHGDAHAWNFLYPTDPSVRMATAIDFEDWHVGFPGWDLATFMALFWDAPRRDKLQIGLLKAYYADLRARGVEGYGWRDLWDDYRRGVAFSAIVPLFQWTAGHDPSLWTATVENWYRAYTDLNCSDVMV